MDGKQLFQLSGADTFLIALESHKEHEIKGNQYCYYVFELEGKIDTNELRALFNSIRDQQLNNWQIKGRHNFLRPNWTIGSEDAEIEIRTLSGLENITLSEVYDAIQQFDTELDNACVFYHHQEGQDNSIVVFRWNHLLMDAYGVYHYLKNLLKPNQQEIHFFPENVRTYFKLWPFYKIVRFISNSSHKPIFFPTEHLDRKSTPLLNMLKLDAAESKQVMLNAQKYGSVLFKVNFLLACISKSVDAHFNEPGDFWVPIPINARKKGILGPIFSNPLSFYFFRIKRRLCSDIGGNMKDIQKQMSFQSSKLYPFYYRKLTEFMRFLPLHFYYIFVKGWKRKSHASFMFTFAHKHEKEFNTFLNLQIKSAINIPPNTAPPGLTFSFMEFNEQLHLLILSREHVLNQSESASLMESVKQQLLNA